MVSRKLRLQKKTKRNYRVVDLGAGEADAIRNLARKNPNRQYVAVDQAYRDLSLHARTHPLFRQPGIQVESKTNVQFLRRMIRDRKRTDRLTMFMPQRYFPLYEAKYEFIHQSQRFSNQIKRIIQLLPKVMIPNGRFVIVSEDRELLQRVSEHAQQSGLRVRPVMTLPFDRASKKSNDAGGVSIYHGFVNQLVITVPAFSIQKMGQRKKN